MEKRLSDRLDIYFWWFVWLLPLIGSIICFFMGTATTYADFAAFIAEFRFDFIAGILADLENVVSFTFPAILKEYASYVVSVEIIHVFVDVMVFVPRFCHHLVQPNMYDWGMGGNKK